MAIVNRMSLRTEVVYSDDMNHRYIIRKEWDKNKPKATIIMINPSSVYSILIINRDAFEKLTSLL